MKSQGDGAGNLAMKTLSGNLQRSYAEIDRLCRVSSRQGATSEGDQVLKQMG